MRPLMHVTEVLRAEVSINLRGGQRNVAQKLLDSPQIGPAFEQVRSERVPQSVGRQVSCRTDLVKVVIEHAAHTP